MGHETSTLLKSIEDIASAVSTNNYHENSKKPDDIQCGKCTFIQPSTNSICEVCGNDMATVPTDEWQCSACTFLQRSDNQICAMCGQRKTDINNASQHHSHTSQKKDEPQQIPINSPEQAIEKLKIGMKEENVDNIDIDCLLNSYLYLLHNYNGDMQFEHVYHELGGHCDITKCVRFKRNTRDRSIHCKPHQSYDIAKHDIMDKIHCYYRHAFDSGFRLTKTDRNDMIDCDAKMEDEHIHKIITDKQKCLHAHDHRNQYRKYNQCEPQLDADKVYSFGKQFKYSMRAHAWSDEKFCRHKPRVGIEAKYGSLKEEMILNGVMAMTIDQFDNEYTKALNHFNCQYCKKHIQPNYMCWELKVEYLLALMIYCNYDHLQCAFSKTYREDAFKEHCNFYYLGYYLKVAIHIFGTVICMTRKRAFYHGISKKYYFPAYDSCYIFGPLSTSISYPVAVRFAEANQGLIVELADNDSSLASAVYFAVEWLSDFPKEREHLFIQNAYPMRMTNIMDPAQNIEYQSILLALQIFGDITKRKRVGAYVDISQGCSALLCQIIQRQLASQQCETTGAVYANKLIDTYFRNTIAFDVRYSTIRDSYPFLFELLFDHIAEWIKLDALIRLCPNLELLTIREVTLSSDKLNSILVYCCDRNCKLEWITIEPRKTDNDWTVEHAISQYKPQFRLIGFCSLEVSGELVIVSKYSKAYQMLAIFPEYKAQC
eukprot:669945_1